MVVLNRIYTRTGDDGTTALGTGERRKKYDLRVAAYGTIDETNAAIGLARLFTGGRSDEVPEGGSDGEVALDAMLGRIQNDLFDLGADLATPEARPGRERLTVTEAQVTRLEAEIDRMNGGLPALRSFVLPGGCRLNAELHVCRTVCRRAERICVTLARQEPVDEAIVRYLNRLSDALFVWSRWASHTLGVPETLWEPNRATSGQRKNQS